MKAYMLAMAHPDLARLVADLFKRRQTNDILAWIVVIFDMRMIRGFTA